MNKGKTMIYTNIDLEEHIQALENTFALVAEAAGFSTSDLIALRNKVVEERGKYDVNWKDDPEEKLAFDFYYCVEMRGALLQDNDLSEARRLRLWRFATKNPHIKAIWDLAPYYDPKAFLSQEQMDNKVWKQPKHWKKKKTA
tara:strand:+ start:7487 stop:7912 length:426 start_codon:yes stop_codon:yes gene_type:complete